MSLKEQFKEIIRICKKSEFGGVWNSPVGPIAITNKGEVARFGRLLPKYEDKDMKHG